MYYNDFTQPQPIINPMFRRLMIDGSMPSPDDDQSQNQQIPTYGSSVPNAGQQVQLSQPPQPSLMERISALLQESKPNTSRYNQYVQQGPPTKEQYEPSGWRKAAALGTTFLTSLGKEPGNALEAGKAVLDDPYKEVLGKYQLQGQHLKEAAGVEETGWEHRLSALREQATVENQIRDDERNKRNIDSLISDRDSNAQVMREKAANSNLGFHIDQNTGMGYIVKPNGDTIQAGKFNLSTGERIQEYQKKSDIIEGRQADTSARNFGNAKIMQGIKFGEQKQMEDIRQGNRKELKGTPSYTESDKPKPVNPAAIHRAEADAANELLNTSQFSWLTQPRKELADASGQARPLAGMQNGNVIINRPTADTKQMTKDQINQKLDEFITAYKANAEARMNRKTTPSGTPKTSPTGNKTPPAKVAPGSKNTTDKYIMKNGIFDRNPDYKG